MMMESLLGSFLLIFSTVPYHTIPYHTNNLKITSHPTVQFIQRRYRRRIVASNKQQCHDLHQAIYTLFKSLLMRLPLLVIFNCIYYSLLFPFSSLEIDIILAILEINMAQDKTNRRQQAQATNERTEATEEEEQLRTENRPLTDDSIHSVKLLYVVRVT